MHDFVHLWKKEIWKSFSVVNFALFRCCLDLYQMRIAFLTCFHLGTFLYPLFNYGRRTENKIPVVVRFLALSML
jgi:hypothetical protein